VQNGLHKEKGNNMNKFEREYLETEKFYKQRAKKWGSRRGREALRKSFLKDTGGWERFIKPVKRMTLEEYQKVREQEKQAS
jgi:hypothetical protein